MKVLVHHAASPGFREAVLQAAPPEARCVFVDERDRDGLRTALTDADALLHVLEPLRRADFEGAPRLRLVQKIGVGVNTIDLDACRALGIGVANMPGTNTAAVAELTLALMLSALRRVPALDAEVRAGRGFPLSDALLDVSHELGGRTVVLVGYGAVAKRLVPVLRALDANVVVVSRSRVDDPPQLPLDEALPLADVVSLHLPLTEESRGLLSRERIQRMKRSAVVVNTARGGLVDQGALTDALRSGALAAAGLDVFADEPVSREEPLLSLSNVVLSPHVAWRTVETLQRSFAIAFDNCRRAADGRTLLHEVVAVRR